MGAKSLFFSGITQAFAMAVLSSFFYIFMRLANYYYDFKPITYTCVALISTSFVLALVAGPGRFVRDTIRSWQTWVYGFLLIGAYIADVYFVKYASATEVGLFNRITVPAALLLAFVASRRVPSRYDVAGAMLVLLGLALLLHLQSSTVLVPVLVLTAVTAIMRTGMYFVSEVHTQSGRAHREGTLRDKLRVVAFVSFVTAGLFLLLSTGVSFWVHMLAAPALNQSLFFVPHPADFAHFPSIVAGLFFGALVAPVNRYFKWTSSYKIKSETVLAILAFIPLITLAGEWALSGLPAFQNNLSVFEGARGQGVLQAVALITLGAGFATFMKIREQLRATGAASVWQAFREGVQMQRNDSSIHHSATAKDDYDIICATLEYTRGNFDKASSLLCVPVSTLMVLHQGKGTLALTEQNSQHLARNYRTHVASRDALTGLYNRSGFMAEMKKRLAVAPHAVVVYLDLDKFKPVNDQHGHAVGDAVLKEVGRRLQTAFHKKTLVGRMGGDEFCLLITGLKTNDIPSTCAKIQQLIAAPYTVQNITAHIACSVGVAQFPQHSRNSEELIRVADLHMYHDKKTPTPAPEGVFSAV